MNPLTAKFVNRLPAKLMNRLTTKLVDYLTAKLVDCLTAKLVDCLTAKLVVVNLVKLHLTKFYPKNVLIVVKCLKKHCSRQRKVQNAINKIQDFHIYLVFYQSPYRS